MLCSVDRPGAALYAIARVLTKHPGLRPQGRGDDRPGDGGAVPGLRPTALVVRALRRLPHAGPLCRVLGRPTGQALDRHPLGNQPSGQEARGQPGPMDLLLASLGLRGLGHDHARTALPAPDCHRRGGPGQCRAGLLGVPHLVRQPHAPAARAAPQPGDAARIDRMWRLLLRHHRDGAFWVVDSGLEPWKNPWGRVAILVPVSAGPKLIAVPSAQTST